MMQSLLNVLLLIDMQTDKQMSPHKKSFKLFDISRKQRIYTNTELLFRNFKIVAYFLFSSLRIQMNQKQQTQHFLSRNGLRVNDFRFYLIYFLQTQIISQIKRESVIDRNNNNLTENCIHFFLPLFGEMLSLCHFLKF